MLRTFATSDLILSENLAESAALSCIGEGVGGGSSSGCGGSQWQSLAG